MISNDTLLLIFYTVIFTLMIRDLVIAIKRKNKGLIKFHLFKIFCGIIVVSFTYFIGSFILRS